MQLDITSIHRPDSILSIYIKALMPSKHYGQKKQTLPKIGLRLKNQCINATQLRQYCDVCDYPINNKLPVLYPQILSFPLQMQLLTDKRFPLPVLGLVHIANKCTQYQPIKTTDRFTITCYIDEQRETEKGTEFDIVTEIDISQKKVWEGTATILSRCKKTDRKNIERPHKKTVIPLKRQESWHIEPNTGRRYSRPSRDRNPIHLFALSAKSFGFKRAIAHGMWSKAKSLSSLSHYYPATFSGQAITVECQFKLPIFLPSTVQLQYEYSEKGDIQFTVLDQHGTKPHLVGSVSTHVL